MPFFVAYYVSLFSHLEFLSAIPTPSLQNWLLFASSLVISACITALILRNRPTWGMDAPDEKRKLHGRPISRLGGLPIFVTLLLGSLFASQRIPGFTANWWPIILTCSIIFLIGFIDDLRPLGARIKLLGQIGAASILYSLGISIDVLTNPLGDIHFSLGWWSLPITLLWLVAITNFINLIDGMDGLATGFGLFLCATLAVVGHFAKMPDVVLISVVMGGALLGFLIFNLPPAKIFLGDGGAYLIGFFIASVSLMSSNKGSIIASLLVVLIALGVPILDTLFAIVRRAIRGVPIFRADSEHIHHRLILLGFSKTRALIALYSICLVLSLIGISLLWNRGLSLPIAGGCIFLLAISAARYLGYVKSWRDVRSQLNKALTKRREMLYASSYGKLLQWEAERSSTPEEFIAIFSIAVERLGMRMRETAGFIPVRTPLVTGFVFELQIPLEMTIADVWRAKIDMLSDSLNVATEKWGILPGMIFLPSNQPKTDSTEAQ